jgi:hypothetical protein
VIPKNLSNKINENPTAISQKSHEKSQLIFLLSPLHCRVLLSNTSLLMLLLSPLPLLAWARAQGAHISESIDIRSTEYGGRGLFAITDIPANAKLITIPGHLQLGVGQLAEGDDDEMQKLSRELPWRDVLEQGLNFLPCSIALCAERRKGAASIFAPYFSELPSDHTNAVAFCDVSGDDVSISSDLLNDLESWTPVTAHKVKQRRTGMTTLHEQLAPPSLPLRDLCLASGLRPSCAPGRW